MPSMLVTVKISKGFKVWTDMAKSLEKEAGEQGAIKFRKCRPNDFFLKFSY